jgi:hypothetical protein
MPVLFLLLALAADLDRSADVVRLDSGQSKLVEVVSQEKNDAGDDVTIVLNPKADQFTVDFDWQWTNFRHMVIVVKGGKKWDTLRYFPAPKKGKYFVELNKTRGIIVDDSGPDCRIEFKSLDAAKELPPYGRLLFRFLAGNGPQVTGTPVTIKRPRADEAE